MYSSGHSSRRRKAEALKMHWFAHVWNKTPQLCKSGINLLSKWLSKLQKIVSVNLVLIKAGAFQGTCLFSYRHVKSCTDLILDARETAIHNSLSLATSKSRWREGLPKGRAACTAFHMNIINFVNYSSPKSTISGREYKTKTVPTNKNITTVNQHTI